MAFDDVRFPTAIARGAVGGPERKTDIVTTASGREERNGRWADSRRRYNAGFGLASLDDIEPVVAFFEERRGRLHAFRFKDHADYKSCPASATPAPTDQTIATGDGTARTFQLRKRYGSGLRDHWRTIVAPVPGSVVVAVAGVVQTDFNVDSTTGLVTLAAAPAAGAVVMAGFEFDVPVRFDTDHITISLAQFNAGEIPDIPLLEVRS